MNSASFPVRKHRPELYEADLQTYIEKAINRKVWRQSDLKLDPEANREIQRFIRRTKAKFRPSTHVSYYHKTDTISIPRKKGFFDETGFYRSVFHELAHWTAHPDRLDRKAGFGYNPKNHRNSRAYNIEEMIAEMTSIILLATFGLKTEGWHLGTIMDRYELSREDIEKCRPKAVEIVEYLLALTAPKKPGKEI